MNSCRICNILILAVILILKFVWGSHDYSDDDNSSAENLLNQLKFSVLETQASLIDLEFLPIRIHVHETNWETLNSVEVKRLREIIRNAVEKTSTLLAVRRVKGNLYLKRKRACKKYFIVNGNNEKCSVLASNYQNEYCIDKIDSFIIPNDHLMGINHYNTLASEIPSNQSLISGAGIPNSDFVAYITVKQTDNCQSQDIMAYSSHCQLGKNNRPIAGFVNFCPQHLKNDKFSFKKSVLATIHELFHTLGFSSDLFKYFKDCDSIGNCYDQKVVVKENNRDVIILPTVIDKMQKHFGCDDPDFGAILNLPEKNMLRSSHWDPIIFHYSIMAPRITDVDLTAIDAITLSLFEGTGWYRVNYSAADNYLWGKGSGCNLLQFEDCSYDYTCVMNEERYGCDLYHTTKSKCEMISKVHKCGIYKNAVEKCSDRESSCFITEINSTKSASCFKYRCINNSIEIKVEEKWFDCPKDSQIDFQFLSEYETVYCQSENLCLTSVPIPNVLAFKEQKLEHCCQMWFKISSPTPAEVTLKHFKTLEEIEGAATRRLAEVIHVPFSWIQESKLSINEEESRYWMLVTFYQPSGIVTDEEDLRSQIRLRNLIAKGNTTVDLQELKYVSPMESQYGFGPNDRLKGLTALWLVLGVVTLSAILAAIAAAFFDRRSRNKYHTNVPIFTE